MSDEDWKAAWQPVVDQVGNDLGEWRWTGADVIDDGMIRRLCEVLELDRSLLEEGEAPVTAALPFSLPAVWEPGEPTAFPDAGRDAQPRRSQIAGIDVPGAPPTPGFFVTDMEIDFTRPARVGERLHQTGLRLLDCTPKQTAVGRGAFMTFETELRTDPAGELVSTYRMTTFSYVPA